MLVARGQITTGLTRLREARRFFTAMGMTEDSGLCALNIVEVLVERGQLTEARSLADDVVGEFEAALMNHRAIDTVKSIRDAISVDDAPNTTAHTVHAMIETLQHEFFDDAN